MKLIDKVSQAVNNSKFYDSSWKIMTENGKNMKKICFKPIKIEGKRAIFVPF